MVSVWPYGLRRGTVCLGGFLWSVREGLGMGVGMDVELWVRGRLGRV